jgi:hypothetical protein
MNQHATTDESFEAVFSVVRAMDIATQWCAKHVSAPMNRHATTEELLEMVFSTQSVPRGYLWDKFRA